MSKILIVDDDPNIALLVQMALSKRKGYKIEISSNGMDALEKIKREPPDLVLLDIMMPGINGFDVCKKIKSDEKTKFIPVIMVTAKSEMADKIYGMDIGANDYITKPFNPDELLARVQAHLRIKALESELADRREVDVALKMAVTLQHEINNPLTGIIGSMELMQDWETLEKEEIDEILKNTLALSIRIKEIMVKVNRISKVVATDYLTDSEMVDLEQSIDSLDP